MLSFLIIIFIVALLAAFIILLIGKLGFIEYVQVHGNKLFSQMFNCNFCLSFWSAVLICVVLFLVIGNYKIFMVPFCSTPLTRFLL